MEIKHPFIVELEQAFSQLNKFLFNGKIKKVPFSIHVKKKVVLRWVPESKTIAIGLDIAKLEFGEILGVLLHEMIHIVNDQADLPDVTTNQYHNKYFLQQALAVGFVVIKHKTQGWAITGTVFPRNVIERAYIKRPTRENVLKRVKAFDAIELDKNLFKELQNDIKGKTKLEKPTKTYFLKYQCNCLPPHNSIRSGRRPDGPNALNIQCLNCRSQFVCVTDLGPD